MRKVKRTAIFLLLVILPMLTAAGETALVPGEIYQICSYTDFFYNYPSEDFFYYLNDRLLFLEKPDGQVMPSGVRNKLLKIVRWHRLIRKSIQRVKKDNKNMITINVDNPEGFKKAAVLMNLLGQNLSKTPDNKYHLVRSPTAGSADYFQFSMLNAKTIEIQLNKTRHLHIKLAESYIPIPWDYEFLRDITGLKLNAANFFETLLKNEQFSLLLGILYRLSDKEINRIGSLMKGIHLGAWKQIYKNKKFLMGMFLLSHGLRVSPAGEWIVPGGAAAEAFWSYLAEVDCRKAPLSFLRSLAVKDNGKLNYFYIFSTFLPPETQKALFTGPNAGKMKSVYEFITLKRQERLKSTQFPGIKDSSFFTFLYSLRMEGDRFHVPLGEGFWLKTISPGMGDKFSFRKPEKPKPSRTQPLDDEEVGAVGEEGVTEIASGKIIVFGSEGAKEGADVSNTTYAFYVADKTDDAGIPTTGSHVPTSSKAGTRKLRNKYLADVRRGFYLKVCGGAHISDGGDFRAMIDSNKSFHEKTSGLPFFLSWAGEFGYSFGRISVGLEGGRVAKYFDTDLSNTYFDTNYRRSLSAFRILVNLYYKVLDSPSLKASIYGGGGLYFGRYDVDYLASRIGFIYNNGLVEKSRKNAPGYHLGVCFELFIWKKLALVFDTRYCLVDFNDLSGKGEYITPSSKYDYEGDLNFDTSEAAGFMDFYLGIERFVGDPSALRKAELNLNGFALTLGAKWYF